MATERPVYERLRAWFSEGYPPVSTNAEELIALAMLEVLQEIADELANAALRP